MAGITHHTYTEYRRSGKDVENGSVGGNTKRYIAGGALNVGDIVLLTAADTVNKSATAADLAAFAGVVVSGDLLSGQIPDDTSVASVNAASSGGYAIVQYNGIAYALAGGTVTIGTHLSVIGDTTAGRVIAGTTAGIIVGTPVESGSVGVLFRILINQR